MQNPVALSFHSLKGTLWYKHAFDRALQGLPLSYNIYLRGDSEDMPNAGLKIDGSGSSGVINRKRGKWAGPGRDIYSTHIHFQLSGRQQPAAKLSITAKIS